MPPDTHTKIFDISPVVHEQTAVWPGDIAFRRQIQMDIHSGAHLQLSSFTSTVHIGAHADAPLHYHPQGLSMESVALEPYLGRCWVAKVPYDTKSQLIEPKHLPLWLTSINSLERVLLRTDSQPHYQEFPKTFAAIAPEVIDLLAPKGLKLIGIDTPSVDVVDSKTLPTHQKLYQYDVRNLEGLTLSHVADGEYELIALPLRLQGFDASPVRAVLRTV